MHALLLAFALPPFRPCAGKRGLLVPRACLRETPAPDAGARLRKTAHARSHSHGFVIMGCADNFSQRTHARGTFRRAR